MYRISTLFVVLLSCSIFSKAQSLLPELKSETELVKRDLVETKALIENSEVESPIFVLGVARTYYKLDEYKLAAKYYLKVINESICSPLDYKALAISLRQVGSYALANDFYLEYIRSRGVSPFNSLWTRKAASDNPYVRISEKTTTNYNMVYGSINTNGDASLNVDGGTVTANMGCNTFNNQTALIFPADEFLNVGSFSKLSDDHFVYSYRTENNYYALFEVERKNGKWSKPQQIDLGETSANYAFPLYANNYLYFASTKSGGYGGYDLYRCFWDGKRFESPKNLGDYVNTDKNEILPSTIDGQFSFASNGWPGAGGYDVYISTWNFDRLITLEYPFNSEANDYLVVSENREMATILKEKDDKINLNLIRVEYDYSRTMTGTVLGPANEPVTSARVAVTQVGKKQGVALQTSEDGEFTILLPDSASNWNIEVYKPGYVTTKMLVNLNTLGANPLIVPLSEVNKQEPEPVFIVNTPSRSVIPAKPEETEGSIDSSANNGEVFNEVGDLPGNSYYIIYASARSYQQAYSFWSKFVKQDPTAEILTDESKGIYRVGLYAGTSHGEAMTHYRKAKKKQSTVWILRPDML